MGKKIVIRKYVPSDRKSIKYIQLATFFLGKPIFDLLDTPEILNDELHHYLDLEPESCFVAIDDGKIVGYLLGCLDDEKHNESLHHFFWKMLAKTFQIPFMKKKDRKFWKGQIRMVFSAIFGSGEETKFKTPKDSGHLHINLLPKARGMGVGTRLLREFFKYAKANGTKLIHADSFHTRLNPNSNFWLNNGFKEHIRVRTSFWREYLPEEKIDMVCYVRKL